MATPKNRLNGHVPEVRKVHPDDVARLMDALRARQRAERELGKAQLHYADVEADIMERYHVLPGEAIDPRSGAVTVPTPDVSRV